MVPISLQYIKINVKFGLFPIVFRPSVPYYNYLASVYSCLVTGLAVAVYVLAILITLISCSRQRISYSRFVRRPSKILSTVVANYKTAQLLGKTAL